jgi:acetylornithine deacetylase/succinyl-diaminopimelate desuccinylase-like protein
MKKNNAWSALAAACITLSLSSTLPAPALAADQAARGPFDAKARELLEHVIAIPTWRGNDKVPEMAEYLASEFRAAGFPEKDVTVLNFDNPGDKTAALVVRYRGDGSGGKPILLLSHMDVVAAKREDWVRDPFKLTEEDGYFFGRGTKDVKDGVVALTATFLRLKKEGFKPKRDLIIFFSGDEENAQLTTVATVRDHRALVDGDYALNSDAGGGALDEATGKASSFSLGTAEKTYADFALTTHNPGGHSSQPREKNAIYDLSAALLKVAQYSFPVMWNDTTLAYFRATGKTHDDELGAAMTRFGANPRDAAAAAVLAADFGVVGKIRTTCVATQLAGGHAPNALPQSATANVNCRIFPGVKPGDVQQKLQELVGKDVEVKSVTEPMSSDASPLRPDVVDAVTRAVHKVYPGVPIVPNQDSGASDGLVFRAAGIPAYGVEAVFIKPSEEFSHGLNERIPVDSFYRSLEIWYQLVTDVGGKRKK